jgi:DNA-binding NtrC family response regulator
VSPEEIDRLMRHDWPGNVRELRNVVSVALAYDRGSGPVPIAEHITEQAPRTRKAQGAPLVGRPYSASKREHDRVFFTALYEATDGKLAEMARRAEINRETVRAYVRAHRIGSYAKES